MPNNFGHQNCLYYIINYFETTSAAIKWQNKQLHVSWVVMTNNVDNEQTVTVTRPLQGCYTMLAVEKGEKWKIRISISQLLIIIALWYLPQDIYVFTQQLFRPLEYCRQPSGRSVGVGRAFGQAAGNTSFVSALTSIILHGSFSNLARTLIGLKSQKSLLMRYNNVIMGVISSQITSLTIVYSIVYSDADQRKHQSSASLAFVREIHRGPVNSLHKWPVTRKMFLFDDAIMGGSDLLNMHIMNHLMSW